MTAPYYYDYENVHNIQCNPSMVHLTDNATNAFYTRYLLKRAFSVFKFTLPENWDKNYFLYTLFCFGFGCVFDAKIFGISFQACGIQGYNLYYNPTTCIIANPILDGKLTPDELSPKIGRDCVLIKLMPDFSSIMPIITFFANKLSLLSEASDMNVINSKLAYVFEADTKAQAESFKKLFDKIQSGEPAVVYDRGVKTDLAKKPWNVFANNLKSNYINPDILTDTRTVMNEFDSFIGIPNANTQKKERMLTDEVNANNVETAALSEIMFETISDGFDKAKEMFPEALSELKIERRFKNNDTGNNVNTGNLSLSK